MTSVGEILRSARETQGRGVAEIAEELCITQRYLHALERDDLTHLPGTFFYRSFVKQYAAILGVPIKKLQPGIDLLTRDEEPEETAQPDERPVRAGNAIRVLDPLVEASNRYFSNRKIGVPMAALALALLTCSGFYRWWSQPPRQQARETPVTTVQGNAAAARVELSATADPDNVNHVVLNLSATEKVWLSITNNEGKQIFSGVLQPSQTKTLTAADAAQMRVGNAGGIEVRLNGKDIGPLGERGQVKTILFTPDKFQIVEPPQAATDTPL
jgi:transcriptional regulator with XRE-family HTH domain